ncbi:MAG: hypothetical protein HKN62_19140 [Phycisphaerales bacterium]|nr:hypothetical protein [Phycisphaerales bacterium]
MPSRSLILLTIGAILIAATPADAGRIRRPRPVTYEPPVAVLDEGIVYFFEGRPVPGQRAPSRLSRSLPAHRRLALTDPDGRIPIRRRLRYAEDRNDRRVYRRSRLRR